MKFLVKVVRFNKEKMMDNFGISFLFSIFNILLLVSWVVLSLISLFKIKNQNLSSTAKAIWVLIVICLPIIGAVALFIINPSESIE